VPGHQAAAGEHNGRASLDRRGWCGRYPRAASQTEVALRGQAWTQDTVQSAIHVLRSEFTPLSDLRASADYRKQVLGNLLQRFWLESQGQRHINLESFICEGESL
jgi:xanthine dehydrogenase small subunit